MPFVGSQSAHPQTHIDIEQHKQDDDINNAPTLWRQVMIKIDPSKVIAYANSKSSCGSRRSAKQSSAQSSTLPDWLRASLLDAESVVLPVIDLQGPYVSDQRVDATKSIMAAVEDANREDVKLPEIHISDC